MDRQAAAKRNGKSQANEPATDATEETTKVRRVQVKETMCQNCGKAKGDEGDPPGPMKCQCPEQSSAAARERDAFAEVLRDS